MGCGQYPLTLFIMGTDRDIGKTVTSMGIISKLLSPEFCYHPEDIGYIKPVGQQTRQVEDPSEGPVMVDKDVLLIAELYGLALDLGCESSPLVSRGYYDAVMVQGVHARHRTG